MGAVFNWSGPEWAARELFWAHAVDEVESLAVWCDLARGSDSIVDVGANLGIYTLAACSVSPTARVIAFEPVPTTAAQLRANVAANGWSERCDVHEVAVSDRSGTAELHIPGDYSPMASLDPSGFRGKPGTLTPVEIDTLDRSIAPGTTVDLVKIDVEKFEDAVLRGMTKILENDRPTLLIECLPDGPFESVQQILLEANYRLFHLIRDGPKPVDRIVPDPSERFRNFLAVGRDGNT